MFQFPAFAPVRLYIQRQVIPRLTGPRFRIPNSPDRRLIANSPEHIAGFHVFRRFSMPRHPPYTLKSLTTFIDHRHVPRRRTSDPALRAPSGRAGHGCQPPSELLPTGSTRSITDHFAKKGARRYLPEAGLKLLRLPDGRPKNGQISRRFILQINLEPRIHLSKSTGDGRQECLPYPSRRTRASQPTTRRRTRSSSTDTAVTLSFGTSRHQLRR
jgi:hypothetical protein